MSIVKVEINNFKSLKNFSIELNQVNSLIGGNGVGKSNILKAFDFFYRNLTDELMEKVFDNHNPYNNKLEISITYNFSRIMRVVQKTNFSNKNSFFKALSDFEKNLDENYNFKVSMVYTKRERINWNISYKMRSIIKHIFPFHFIEARHINLTDWEELWNMIGEVANLKGGNEEKLNEVLAEIYGEKYNKNISNIKKTLTNNSIGISKFNVAQKFSNIYQIHLGGDQFNHFEKGLNYYSDGINSNNYIKVFLELVETLSYSKLKDPLVILDEPELNLHPNLIDDLIACILSKNKTIQTIIATHSSRVIKEVISDDLGALFQLSYTDGYTKIKKMNVFNKNAVNIVSEKEASLYFAKKILFVEGQTELDIFLNKYIQEIYPFLSKVELFAYDSNNKRLNILHPKERNTTTPFLLLLDMDKIFHIDRIKNEVVINKGENYNPLANKNIQEKEIYLYGNRRIRIKNKKMRIKRLKKEQYAFDLDYEFINDKEYANFKHLIRSYCSEYNVYPVDTTIEGSIINEKSYELVLEWLGELNLKTKDNIESLLSLSNDINYKVTIMRVIMNGKLDTLNNLNNKKPRLPQIQSQYQKIEGNKKFTKTEWVSDFLEYYFVKVLDITNLKDLKNNEQHLATFRMTFPEIHDILSILEKNM
ncbi:retron Eco8 family effector endonuclease [Alkalicoccobacillus gibsonii]|uniref:retron Eco8 family effector endonuclease n=1 Tax=Alkalicoccobacillus gibsonii TaxID=79881 RepID=UPI003F7B6EFA